MALRYKFSLAFVIALFLHLVASQSFNPTILQDSRDLPKVDGTFGFLYRTEDGIAHAAKGDANGVIHGRFSYTDPTGLKVNYNYYSGSITPGREDEPASGGYQQPQRQVQNYQARQEDPEPQYNDYDERPQYVEPEPEYVPQTRPSARSQARRPSPRAQFSARYREPVENYPQPRRTRPTYATRNEVYDDYRN